MKTKIIKNSVLFLIFLLIGNHVHGYEIYECTLKTIDICDINLSIITLYDNYSNGEKIEFYPNLSIKIDEFIMEYWIEDYNRSIIKDKRNTTNLNKKSYTPNLDESGFIKIKSRLINLRCDKNIESEKTIFVKDNRNINPDIRLINLSKNLTILSEGNINFTLEYYSGNVESSLITLNFGNINNQSFKTSKKYYETKKQIKIPYDCNMESKEYILKINGFNLSIEKNISVLNSCNVGELNEPLDTEQSYNLSENNINSLESQITGYAISEPKNQLMHGYLIYILLGIITLCMWFLWKSKSALKNKNGISYKSDN